MRICIVSATSLELQYLSKEHQVLITGVGTASTIYHLMKELQRNKPHLFLQAGIAGSFDESISPGQSVVVNSDRFADLGVQENDQWNDVFDMKLAEGDGWLINQHHQLLSAANLPIVKSISINEITTSTARIKQLIEKYNPAIESMEGAAFHYVCLQEGIPFLQLRTISNYVGERDKSKWQMKLALENLAADVQSFLDRFNHS